MALLTLMTDFGYSSPYVAQIHAAVLSRSSDIRIVDISHEVPPQNILWGACVLEDCVPWFPPGTVHLAVVDPGVGTSRSIIAGRLGDGFVILPDNGLVSFAAKRFGLRDVIRVAQTKELHRNVSSTFHGRDLMAPVAVAICSGRSLFDFGPPVFDWIQLPDYSAEQSAQGWTARIIMIDRFGNLITNLSRQDLAQSDRICRIECQGCVSETIVETYGEAEPGSVIGLFGSSGRFEIAVVNGNAAQRLGVDVGMRVEITKQATREGSEPH